MDKAELSDVIRLSICIATLNRGSFIEKTLTSILDQIEPGVELVVVDGASTDKTPELMASYCAMYPQLVYRREPTNSGVDADYDKAVLYASGNHCWLMTDDDILKPGAISRVLAALESRPQLIVVNAEVRSVDLSELMEPRRLPLKADSSYASDTRNQFLAEVGAYLSFIGCVIIERALWVKRERKKYYGSLFIHVAVIFQEPSIKNVLVLGDPLIEIRYGNAMWTPRGFEIWMFKWPGLVWSFPEYSDVAKRAVCRREPWRSAKALFHQRAMGSFSVNEFRKFWPENSGFLTGAIAWLISRFPAKIANFIMVAYFGFKSSDSRMALYDLLHSRHASLASARLARFLDLDARRE